MQHTGMGLARRAAEHVRHRTEREVEEAAIDEPDDAERVSVAAQEVLAGIALDASHYAPKPKGESKRQRRAAVRGASGASGALEVLAAARAMAEEMQMEDGAMSMATLGGGLLWIASLGMNGGSALGSTEYAVRGVLNTQLSACAALDASESQRPQTCCSASNAMRRGSCLIRRSIVRIKFQGVLVSTEKHRSVELRSAGCSLRRSDGFLRALYRTTRRASCI